MMSKIILILYLLVGLVPYFGAADKSHTQILYLQITNVISFLFIVYSAYKSDKKMNYLRGFNSLSFQFFFVFLIWASTSTFFAINKIESLRILNEIVTYIISFICLYILMKNISKKFFINLLLLLTAIEVFAILLPFLRDIAIGGNYIARSASYSGVTGNINIAAFALLVKMPFVIYFILNDKTRLLKKIISYLILCFSVFSIFFVLSTRGAMLGIIIIFILIILYGARNLFLNIEKAKSFLFKILKVTFIPFLFTFALSTALNFTLKRDSSFIERIGSVGSENDGSSQERIRYWKQSFQTIKENPLFGIGIGNWKIVGIDKEEDNLRNYIVPYHVHNDFLELIAETGIIGGLSFFMVFIIPFLYLMRHLIKKLKIKENVFEFILFLSLLAYFMDVTLNFPLARPIQQILIISITVFCLHHIDVNFNFLKTKNINKLFIYQLSILILLIPLSTYSAIRVYKSSKEQYYLTGQFNANIFSIPLSEIEDYEAYYPNMTGTTIPIKSMQGIYNLKNQRYEEAIKLLKEGNKINPYLQIGNTFIGYSFYELNQPDSAMYYSKIAFEKQPKNMIHYTHYVIGLTMKNDTSQITKTYDRAKNYLPDDELVDKIYFLAMEGLLGKDEKKKIIAKASKSLFQSKDDRLKEVLYFLQYGEEQVLKADKLHKEGLELYNQKKYIEAAQKFEEASALNPLEIPYYENAANAYLQLSNHEKTLEFANYVIDNSEIQNGKAHYIKAIVYLEKKNRIRACELLKESLKYGFNGAENLTLAYCN